jgi:hypothetical protein
LSTVIFRRQKNKSGVIHLGHNCDGGTRCRRSVRKIAG